MIDGAMNNLGNIGAAGSTGGVGSSKPASTTSGSSFADMLKQSINEVSQMQQDASRAVQDISTGKTDDVTGVMSAVEKSDLAFKTLLTIRAKLMDAYDEIKGISV
ncbi:MAG: flagellar hook-basal body complex protein FliE [Tepidisphaeraceae bacterium]|jgi:flagellar hook-basal body complex protein FliE